MGTELDQKNLPPVYGKFGDVDIRQMLSHLTYGIGMYFLCLSFSVSCFRFKRPCELTSFVYFSCNCVR